MKRIFYVIFFVVISVVIAVVIVKYNPNMFFTTKDNVKIAYKLYEVSQPKGYLLLAHMMPATKESWNDFAEVLNQEEFSVLAIDMRGHGESVYAKEGRVLNYQKFSDKEHQEKILDVEASCDWLRNNDRELVGIVGASIGANLALQYQVNNNLPIKTVLLSPGFNYRGVETKPLALKLKDSQAVFYIGGKLDLCSGGFGAAQMAEELFNLSKISNKKLFISESDKHGTDLFKVEKELVPKIISWLE